MEQNRTPVAFQSQTTAGQAATGEPASLPAPVQDESYWRGYHAAVAAMADAPSGDPASPSVRRVRVDGFSGARQAVFLEGIAEGLTVGEAAARAGISHTAVYNFRNRRAGRAFNIAWEAADRRARRPLADHLHDRSLRGQTDTVRDGDGEIVGTRHRHDNRLAMAMLTRLDKKAEASKEDERLVTVIAEAFEEMLDAIEAGPEEAEEFIDDRRPAVEGCRLREHEPRPVDRVLSSWQLRHRNDVDPAEIDISDLDPADEDKWTDDQWARAWRSGLLDRLDAAEKGGD